MKKYISEIVNDNFIYPNNDVSEYDMTISHDINNYYVSGTTGPTIDPGIWTTGDASNSGEWNYVGSSNYNEISGMTINKTDSDSTDMTSYLNLFQLGYQITLNDETDSSRYGIYMITSTPVWSGNTLSFDVEVIEGSGQASGGRDVIISLNGSTITVDYSSSTVIQLSYDYTWSLNGAEPFIDDEGDQVYLTVHGLPMYSKYYKPWRVVDYYKDTYSGATSLSGTRTFTIYPADFNLPKFFNGDYYFEFRFIGHRAVYPIGVKVTISTTTDYEPIQLTGTTNISYQVIGLEYSGTTSNCDYIIPQWSSSDDPYIWSDDNPSSDWCTGSTVYCSFNAAPYGELYFRLKQVLKTGDIVYTDPISHDYGNITLDSVTNVSGNTYTLNYTPLTTNCEGVIVEWSRNQVGWNQIGKELDCSTTTITVDSSPQTDIPYWRVRQIVVNDDLSTSNIITVT